MQIVIEISEGLYNEIQSRDWKNGELVFSEEWKAIHNGIPLPKGHGRIGDLDALRDEISSWGMNDYEPSDFTDEIDRADTIIEAALALEQEPCGDWHDVPSDEMTLGQARQAVKDLRKKLAEYLWQKPCEDEYIKVPKKALKYRTTGMVAYNAEWLKNHFDIERAVICGAQEPCEDCISRRAVLDLTEHYNSDGLGSVFYSYEQGVKFADEVNRLPPVNPQPKTGHWVDIMVGDMPAQVCDKCNTFYPLAYTGGGHKYCPNCGAKMQGVEE